MLVSVEHLTKYQNVKKIVEDVKFAIEDKDKIALIGKNGCGKSTLISMITRQQNSDQGTWFFKKDLKISCLSQDPIFIEQQSALYQVLSTSEDVKDYEAKAILTKLGISDYDQNISVMSGGQRKRVALAQALLKPCDLLILDEPTNHLDYEMINYLEGYLKKWNKALLLVTHDRYFLERICDKIIEMDRGKLYTYEANYSLYLQMKEEREQIALAQNQKRANILRKELAWMRAGVQARGTKSRDRINRFYALSEQEDYVKDDTLSLNLVSSRLGKKVIEWEDIQKSFGDEPLFYNFSYVLKRLDRIGILGENGCGKSTLLKCLAKEIEVDYGSVIHGETVKIGYFHQGHEEMDEAQRVIDYIRETSNAIETSEGTFSATQMLERFLFDSKSMYQPIGSLSGGEKRRLYLLKILMQAPNILFLDEPTNDLDLATLQILEDYLDDFPGAILCVSHDRYFLDRVCDSLFVFEQGNINHSIGGYSAYIEAREQMEKVKEVKVVRQRTTLRMSSAEKRELESMESKTEALSMEIEELMEEINTCEDFKKMGELSDLRDQKESELEALFIRWEELQEKFNEIEAAKGK